MTPEERVARAVDEDYNLNTIRRLVAEAIREAVVEERAACAQIAHDYVCRLPRDDYEYGKDRTSEDIAKRIRARSKP